MIKIFQAIAETMSGLTVQSVSNNYGNSILNLFGLRTFGAKKQSTITIFFWQFYGP